jgi:hypothetical protein
MGTSSKLFVELCLTFVILPEAGVEKFLFAITSIPPHLPIQRVLDVLSLKV